MTAFVAKAGVFVAGAGLPKSAHAKRIVCDGPSRTVIDGPFTETRELIAGFSIWEVKDRRGHGLGGALAHSRAG